MIKLRKLKKNGDHINICNSSNINVAHGQVRINFYSWDGRRVRHNVIVDQMSLVEIRNACNKALNQITGHKYKTIVGV